jgi:HSP20 family protein
MSGTRRPPPARLSDLGLLQREMNQLFERLMPFDRPEQQTVSDWMPSVDVYECSGCLMVVAEVPGLSPEALQVVCSNQQLVIVGERRSRRPGGGTAYLCLERPHGRFSRAIPLDAAVDLSRAEARLSGGLLTIRLPRLEDRRGRQKVIPIEREDP